jgi:spermidine synthase
MAAFSLLFFFSGASALLYQVVWQRMLSTIFGVTVYATSTVLAAFMGGLALGGLLGGRAADRMRRPLLLFSAAEAGIGLSAFATPWALQVAEQLYASLQGRAELDFAGLTAARLLCSFLVLLLPTTLMGATLPAMAAALESRGGALHSRLAALYGVNTLGAFAGTLLAGYVLVGSLGLQGTLRVAVAVNLAVALGGLLIAMRSDGALRAPDGAAAPVAAAQPTLTARQGRVLLGAFAVSGLVALGLEVVWFRMLLAYLPTTTYAFTTMLATVLLGIALGGLLAARRAPRAGELARLGVLLAAAGALSVVSANVLARTYAAGWRTSGLVQACVVALLPATTAMGMSYPRGLALWAASRDGVGFRVGAFSAFNLAGAILGSLLAGFALVPTFGTRVALVALSLLGVLAGLALLRSENGGARANRAFALAASAFVVAAATLPDPFAAARERRHHGETLLWSEEGAQATVAVHRAADGHRVLYIDGTHQANDSLEMRRVHQRIGLLPLLLQPAPKRALVIGLAGGATPGALALDPDVRVDVLELSAAVVRAAELFHDMNGNVLRRGNVRLRVDDGRNHLLLTRERYDILTADLIQPFHAGAGHLYSVEYFRLCRRALARNGLMLQWIGHPPEDQYKLILRTFLEVFPETTLWSEAFLIGSVEPLRLDPERFARIRDKPELAAAMAAAGITDRESLLRLYTAGPAALRRFAGSGEILSDDRPLVEYYRSLGGAARPVDLSKLEAADPGELAWP